jgi:hypothetical protein
MNTHKEALEALKEASISIACLMDDISKDENNDIAIWDVGANDLPHIQQQLAIIENYFGI